MRELGISIAGLLLAAAAGINLATATALTRDFDGPELAWQVLDARPTARVLSHGSANDEVRQGIRSERLSIAAPGGESLHFACDVGRLPVLDELEVRMWLKSTNPGATIAARVILPRTADSKSGIAETVLVHGDACESPDRWQQLRIAHVPERLAAQVRVLRATRREPIDPREAYVDAIVLVVPGGPRNTTVWTDALEVEGVVLASAEASAGATTSPAVFAAPAPPQTGARAAPTGNQAASPTDEVQFRGTTLLVANRPFLPRAIEWHNEPFKFLSARGFNTIWLDELPTPEQAAEARRENLWFISAPPRPETLAEVGLGQYHDRVLAWNLGSQNGPQELDYYWRWAGQVRNLDAAARPLLLAPRGDWLPASQLADALVTEHVAAASLSPLSLTEWLRQRPLLARPGTPLWSAIPTQPGPRARQQSSALVPNLARFPTVLDDAQLRAVVMAAATNGHRGFLFRSDVPLDAADPITRRRAAMLEQWNDRLDLIEPWLTIGKPAGDATSTDGSASGIILQAERARLFIPSTTIVPTGATTESDKLAFILPGIPVSNEAFLLSPASFSTIPTSRVAGGTRIEVPRDFDGYILLTEDPAAISSFRQRVARGARRAAQAQYALAAAQSRNFAAAAVRLERIGIGTKQIDQAIGAADADVKRAGTSLAAGNFSAAFRQSSRASRVLDQAAAGVPSAIVDGPAYDSVPFADHPDVWATHAGFLHSIAALRAGENQLVGGDFENLEQLRAGGWQHVEDPIVGVDTNVQLSGIAPREGRYSLQLTARPASSAEAPQIIARAPVWITSPPMRAMEDEVLEISGWVRIAEPITGNVDALEIVDSLGGRELALRIRQTDGWQPFRMIRGTRETTNVTLTFALHGLGTASIDGVQVRSLASPQSKRLPTVTPEPGPAFPNSAARTLFGPPATR